METDQELMNLDQKLVQVQKQLKALKYRKKARLIELGREPVRKTDNQLTTQK